MSSQSAIDARTETATAARVRAPPPPATVATQRALLLRWLHALRVECRILRALLVSGDRDVMLRHCGFHAAAVKCCRLLGAWYRSFTRPLIAHFMRCVKRRRNRARRQPRHRDTNGTASDARLPETSSSEQPRGARKRRTPSAPHRQSRAGDAGGAAHASERAARRLDRARARRRAEYRFAGASEVRLRTRVLDALLRVGWAATAELSLARRNTIAVALALVAAAARLHALMSTAHGGEFGCWTSW
jgi:hypothetical protein